MALIVKNWLVKTFAGETDATSPRAVDWIVGEITGGRPLAAAASVYAPALGRIKLKTATPPEALTVVPPAMNPPTGPLAMPSVIGPLKVASTLAPLRY